jgi:hypothetical protein
MKAEKKEMLMDIQMVVPCFQLEQLSALQKVDLKESRSAEKMELS